MKTLEQLEHTLEELIRNISICEKDTVLASHKIEEMNSTISKIKQEELIKIQNELNENGKVKYSNEFKRQAELSLRLEADKEYEDSLKELERNKDMLNQLKIRNKISNLEFRMYETLSRWK